MFIVDFDHTLYQTHLFVHDMKAVFASYGIDEHEFIHTYNLAIKWDGGDGYDYTFDRHLDIIELAHHDLPREEIIAKLDACLAPEYVAPDAISFLTFAKERSAPVVLLTAGNGTFQQKKVERSGLAAYVDRIEYVHGDKQAFVCEQEGNEIFFINDNIRENVAVKRECPHVRVITKCNPVPSRRTPEELEASGIPYVDTLTDVQTYVTTYHK